MSTAKGTDKQSPAMQVADRHDLIRVQGARVNNLKDVSVELPKRRLTVFTGVSGSGKSSLVFSTIAEMMAKGTYGWILLAAKDLDAVFEKVQAGDAEVVQEPTLQPYGIRDCAFRDPAGNLVRINERR